LVILRETVNTADHNTDPQCKDMGFWVTKQATADETSADKEPNGEPPGGLLLSSVDEITQAGETVC
jgi:hypothetical protein